MGEHEMTPVSLTPDMHPRVTHFFFLNNLPLNFAILSIIVRVVELLRFFNHLLHFLLNL
jgi:hypothetical protein